MAKSARRAPVRATREEDQRVFLHGVTWEQYDAILEIRGDRAVPRITYLEGELELTSPSRPHETYKTRIARLLEAFAEETGIPLNGYGSWTVRRRRKERGVEADECYVIGVHETKAPDLAIEVIWTSGGIDKLEVYRGLRVREVWLWQDGQIEVHELRRGRYVVIPRSALLPEVDLAELARLAEEPDQTATVRGYRAALRERRTQKE